MLLALLVLLLVAAGLSQGDQPQLENRLYKKLEMFCDNLEDFNEVVSRKRDSLEKHAVSLRFIADKMDQVHKDVTQDMTFWSSIAVGGDLINAGGIILDYMEKASPMVSVAGMAISAIGGYLRENACSYEEDLQRHNQVFADKTFQECEENLQEITALFRELQVKAQDLEEEEGLSGTKFQKRIGEIKMRLSYLEPSRIQKKYSELTSKVFSIVLSVVAQSGQISALKDSFQKSSKDAPVGSSKNSEAISSAEGTVSKSSSQEPLHAVAEPRKKDNLKYAARAAGAASSLYQDGKELVKGIIHLNEGARSELARNLREVATYLENFIKSLDRVLSKQGQGFKF